MTRNHTNRVSPLLRFPFMLPAVFIGAAMLPVAHPIGPIVQFLNHSVFLWGAWAMLEGPPISRIWSALRGPLPTQFLVHVFFGGTAVLMLGVPLALAIPNGPPWALGLLAVTSISFALATLSVWPALAASLNANDGIESKLSSVGANALRIFRDAREKTEDNLGHKLEGLPSLLATLTLSAAPILLYTLRERLPTTAWWVASMVYLLALAPFVSGYLLAHVRRLSGNSNRPAISGTATKVFDAAQSASVSPAEVTQAAADCNLKRLQSLVGNHAGALTMTGTQPLIAAITSNHPNRIPAVQWLLAQGAHAERGDQAGNTPLHHAAYRGDQGLIEALIGHDVDLERLNEDGYTALCAALSNGHWSCAEMLIKQGAEVNPKLGLPPLHVAAKGHNDDPAGVELLAQHKAEPNIRAKMGRSALMGAALQGNAMCVDALLKAGADIDARDDFGNTALMEAARSGANQVLERLVFWNPATEHRDKPGRTALLLAVPSKRADQETIRLLLAMGADPKATNKDGQTAEELAKAMGRGRMTQALRVTGTASTVAAKRSTTVSAHKEESLRIDLSAFATDEDMRWAQRQLEGRSRTQLEAAAQAAVPEPLTPQPLATLAAKEKPKKSIDSRIERPRPTLARQDTITPVVVTASPQLTKTGAAASPNHNGQDPAWRPALDSVVDLGSADESALSEGRSGIFRAASGEATTAKQSAQDTAVTLLAAAQSDDIDRMQTILMNENVPSGLLAKAFLRTMGSARSIVPEWLLDHGLDANATGEDGETLLSTVLRQTPALPSIVEALLEHGATPHNPDHTLLWLSGLADQNNPSQSNSGDGHEARLCELLPKLIEHATDMNAVTESGDNALHWAARFRGAAYAQALIKAGVAINHKNSKGDTPLLLACRGQRPQKATLIRTLVRCGADARVANNAGETAMSFATQCGDKALTKQLMMTTQETVKPKRSRNDAALVEAANAGNLGRVRRLLGQNRAVDAVDENGCSALLRAAGLGHPNIVSCLIAAGADMTLPTPNGTTPLGAAVLGGHREIVRLLHDRGTDIEQPQRFGVTPLMLAAGRGNARMLTLLLELGANVNARDDADGTALMAAVQNVLLSTDTQAADACTRVLLKAGAEIDLANDEGQTALMLLLGVRAKTTTAVNAEAVMALTKHLIKAHANLDHQDLSGWSALHAAAAHGFLEPARALVKAGANKRLRDINGLSACDLAMENSHDELVDLFINQ